MHYGKPANQIFCLNEETNWTGEKGYDHDRKGSYKILPEIKQLLFDGHYAEAEKVVGEKLLAERPCDRSVSYQIPANFFIENTALHSVLNYKRVRDINYSIATTQFEKDGVKYRMACFSSFPDNIMIIKYSAKKNKSINFLAWVERTKNTKILLSDHRSPATFYRRFHEQQEWVGTYHSRVSNLPLEHK